MRVQLIRCPDQGCARLLLHVHIPSHLSQCTLPFRRRQMSISLPSAPRYPVDQRLCSDHCHILLCSFRLFFSAPFSFPSTIWRSQELPPPERLATPEESPPCDNSPSFPMLEIRVLMHGADGERSEVKPEVSFFCCLCCLLLHFLLQISFLLL